MTEFNDTERESKVKQELVKQQLDRLEADVAQLKAKTQQEFYDELRNSVLEETAQAIEKMRGFGNDTISSFAIFIRGMKR
jgi:chorismate mutase